MPDPDAAGAATGAAGGGVGATTGATATGGGESPPKANHAVCVPAPANILLAVPKFPPAAHAPPKFTLVLNTPVVLLYQT